MGLLDSWSNIFLAGMFAVSVLLYEWIRNRLSYFERKNMIYVKSDFIALLKALLADRCSKEDVDQLYNEYPKERYVGYFRGLLPSILIRDPALVDDITKNAFNHFHDRWRHGPDDVNDPLSANLFFVGGSKWKELRDTLSAGFSPDMMLSMFPTMQSSANSTCQYIRRTIHSDQDVDAKEIFSFYTSAVLAQSSGIGLSLDILKDPLSDFRKMLRKFNSNTPTKMFLLRVKLELGYLWYVLKSRSKDAEEYFVNLFKTEMSRRRALRHDKQDFIQLLIQNFESRYSRKNREEDSSEPRLVMNDFLMTSQMILFFQASIESTLSLLTITCFYLAKHSHLQERVRKEVNRTKQTNGVINYIALKDMTFLDHCIAETLRLNPLTDVLMRVCTQNYTLKDGHTIEKGTTVSIPVVSLQRDPKFWTNPELFDPERFIRDRQVPGTYLPFGQGPRICIGQSFALLQVKLMLAKLIESFELSPSPRACDSLNMSDCYHNHSVHGIWLRLKALHATAVLTKPLNVL